MFLLFLKKWIFDLSIEREPSPPPLPKSPPPRFSHNTQQELERVEHHVEPVQERTIIDYHTVEKIRTPLYPQSKERFLSYQNTPWNLNARKEVKNKVYSGDFNI